MGIQVIAIPVSTATSETLLLEVTEKLCKPFAVGGILPNITVNYTTGTVKVVNGNAVIPIYASISIVSAVGKCGCAHTQVFNESVDVAMPEGTTNVVTLTVGEQRIVTPLQLKCDKAHAVRITSTAVLSIA